MEATTISFIIWSVLTALGLILGMMVLIKFSGPERTPIIPIYIHLLFFIFFPWIELFLAIIELSA